MSDGPPRSARYDVVRSMDTASSGLNARSERTANAKDCKVTCDRNKAEGLQPLGHRMLLSRQRGGVTLLAPHQAVAADRLRDDALVELGDERPSLPHRRPHGRKRQ